VIHARPEQARIAAFALAVCALAAPVSADWHFTPLVGLTFLGNSTVLEAAKRPSHKWNFGGAVGKIGAGPLGFEGFFVYTPNFLERSGVAVSSSRSFALMGNLILATPLHWNEYGLRPFVSGGAGVLHVHQQDAANIFPVNSYFFAYDVGGGATGFLTDNTGLRFDVRFFSTFKSEDLFGIAFGQARLHYWTATVGVVLKR
jgi:outer membrane protein with beta-barrel domain